MVGWSQGRRKATCNFVDFGDLVYVRWLDSKEVSFLSFLCIYESDFEPLLIRCDGISILGSKCEGCV